MFVFATLVMHGGWAGANRSRPHEKLGILGPPQAELVLRKLESAVNSATLHANAGGRGTMSQE